MKHPAGESDGGSLRVDFDRRLRLEFHGSRITSDAGLLAYRELDDALGLTDLAGATLSECRRGKNTRHLLSGLFRQSVFGRLAGYEDVNDAERLAHDPAMRAVVDRGGLDRQAKAPAVFPAVSPLSNARFDGYPPFVAVELAVYRGNTGLARITVVTPFRGPAIGP
jgi:hypothetical protein